MYQRTRHWGLFLYKKNEKNEIIKEEIILKKFKKKKSLQPKMTQRKLDYRPSPQFKFQHQLLLITFLQFVEI
jgi:hypothetical protein